jgi:hypothetical protein
VVGCFGLEIFIIRKVSRGIDRYPDGIETGKAGDEPAFVVFGGWFCIVLKRGLNG